MRPIFIPLHASGVDDSKPPAVVWVNVEHIVVMERDKEMGRTMMVLSNGIEECVIEHPEDIRAMVCSCANAAEAIRYK